MACEHFSFHLCILESGMNICLSNYKTNGEILTTVNRCFISYPVDVYLLCGQ